MSLALPQVQVLVLNVVKKSEKPVVVLLSERIEFMIVALSAAQGETHPNRSRRIGAIDQRIPAILFVVHAAFLIEHGVAVESSGDQLVSGRIGQHVAGN